MKEQLSKKKNTDTSIIRKCHYCGAINESGQEQQRCKNCRHSFLPLNYFSNVHATNTTEYRKLFSYAHELQEEDLIKGLIVLW